MKIVKHQQYVEHNNSLFTESPAGFLDKIALTVQTKHLDGKELPERLESIYKSSRYQLTPRRKQLSPYGKTMLLTLPGAQTPVVMVSVAPRQSFGIRPLRVEFNPAKMNSTDTKLLVMFLKQLLGVDYVQVWDALVTRFDATTVVSESIPDDIVATLKDGKGAKYSLDGNGEIISYSVNDPESPVSLTVYRSGQEGNYNTRIELRMRPDSHKAVLLKDLHKIANPFEKLVVINQKFFDNKLFEIGFSDSVKLRTLTGAINRYKNRDPELAEKYVQHIVNKNHATRHAKDELWKTFIASLSYLDSFK